MSHRRTVNPVVLTVRPRRRGPWMLAGAAGLATVVYATTIGRSVGGLSGFAAQVLAFGGVLAVAAATVFPGRSRSAAEWATEVPTVRIDHGGIRVRVVADVQDDVYIPWRDVTSCQIRQGVTGAWMLCFDVRPRSALDGRDESIRRVLVESMTRYGTPVAVNIDAAKHASAHAVLSLNHRIRGLSDGRIRLRPSGLELPPGTARPKEPAFPAVSENGVL